MNIAESAALKLAARGEGWEETETSGDADLILLNTCSVRITAEERVLGRLAHYSALKKKGKSFTLVLAGCMAERVKEKIKDEFPALDYIIGTSERSLFPSILLAAKEKNSAAGAAEIPGQTPAVKPSEKAAEISAEKPVFSFSSSHLEDGSFRTFVPIMHGCNNFCSYCIVPYTRGREISRDPKDIVNEIRGAGTKGVREVTLLGQNVNSYKWEGPVSSGPGSAAVEQSGAGLDFPGLLELIAGETQNTPVKWVRFLSSHPKDLSGQAIKVMSDNPVFCRHLHLCVQSGSNKILKAMNRRYTAEQYLDLTARLREAMPEITLSTDILVGFPGETEEDLDQTLDLMEKVKFLYSYMYHYNPREGTAAFDLPDRIPDQIKQERLGRVIRLQEQHTKNQLKSRLGAEVTVLIEGISKKNADELVARTERDEMAVVPGLGSWIGRFGRIKLESLAGNTFRASHAEILD